MSGTFIDMFLPIGPRDPLREIISSVMNNIGFTGFLEDHRGVHCYIPKERWTDSLMEEIEFTLASQTSPPIKIETITEIPSENWNRRWEESIQPIQVSEKIIITPSWKMVPMKGPSSNIVLIIDPKMSFGTGHHESTRIMLRLLERYLQKGSTVLDVGTGTGVLAIASIKLGASRAIAIDVDEWSFENTKENIQRNGVEDSVEVRAGSMEVVPESSFDVILANIHRGVILELLPAILERHKKTGYLLLSGILREEKKIMVDALHDVGYVLDGVETENEWIGMATVAAR